MDYHTEKCCQKARELALQHTATIARAQPAYIGRQFEKDIKMIREFVISLQDNHSGCAQPSEEWLLDNAEFIEEQALEVSIQLSNNLLGYLPRLRYNGKLRIQSICEDYLAQVDGIWHEESFVSYIDAYQEVSVLTLAEIRCFPLIFKVALIRRVADAMVLVRDRREVCMEVERLLSRIEPSGLSKEAIDAALEAAGQTVPLSGPWIVHLIRHLREWAGDSASVREWLVCKFENGSEDLDRIITFEHQLQASYQVTVGNLITSLRQNERGDWSALLDRINLPDQILRRESAGDYPRLDAHSRYEILNRVELLARRLRVPESLIASQSVTAAKEELERVNEDRTRMDSAKPEDEWPRSTFAAYFVFEPAGIRKVVQSLRQCSQPRKFMTTGILRRGEGRYFVSLIGWFAIALIASAMWIGSGRGLPPAGWLAIVVALMLPVSEWAVSGVHFGIQRFSRPSALLRYDFSSGVSAEAATMVVIPVIWSSPEEVEELADRLEIHHLSTNDPNIHYALLGDFTDAREEKMPEDETIVSLAKARIESLNRTYAGSGGTTFHYLQRSRQWNPGEGEFMGWERKRGKLVEFVELLKGSERTSFHWMSGDRTLLPQIRYVITLDADTQLPMGSAQRMIGTMHLPYNRPRLNAMRTRVVEGYGVLQPRIGISHESAMRSRIAYLLSEPGIDPYVFAGSDPYQDSMGQGIFTGKGIFDVEVFAELLCERIPDNTVLSHDLLEGGFLRAALLSDVELIENHPSSYIAYQKRMHRWVRGDWQLLCWLFTRVCDRRGTLKPVDLSLLTRWQIIDNLRRSLLPPAYFVLLGLALTVLPGSPGRWLVIVFATMLIPVIRDLLSMWRADRHPRGLLTATAHVLIGIWTLPFQSALLLDAVSKTLYRLWISKRRLLEWTSSSHIELKSGGQSQSAIQFAIGGYVLIVVFAVAVVLKAQPPFLWAGLALCTLWALAPLVVRWLDKPALRDEQPLAAADKEQLRRLAKQIWTFYEDFAGPGDHDLPPDNVQIDPPNGVAHRTSPTNIGFLLTASLAARGFGFIDTREFVERLERTITTVERLEKWNGHLYNWYDTATLQTLPPAYVSTVDSGNFVASLMTVKQGLAHWLRESFTMSRHLDRTNVSFKGDLSVELAVELDKISQKETVTDEGEEDNNARSADQRTADRTALSQAELMDVLVRGHHLMNRLETLITSTDFRALYDHKAKLFVLGYHAASGERDSILYDLLASEARLTSFVAIALGQVSVSHWTALGRTAKKQAGHTTLVSWSGTMFEYMMPWLMMRTHRNTIWDSTYRGVVKRQIQYAQERGVPFGISESGYYAFDYQMNYQYRAFGVPGLGFKRGLESDLVLAPYATIMALPYAMQEGLKDLHRMEELGARGTYGFYEAIDYTPGRIPDGDTCKVIRSFMAHHQGMSLLTLANLLLPDKMYDYFHRDKRVEAAELLLIERIPPRAALLDRELSGKTRIQEPKPAKIGPLREFLSADTTVPEVNVHSNGVFTTMVTNSGSGFIRYEGMALSRWREDPVTDPWGSYLYIRDVKRDKVWSPSYQPCRVLSDKQRVLFARDRTSFQREDDDMHTLLEITVSPESNAEVRRLTLSNQGSDSKIIEVTTFLELALALPDADKAHPAFTKLFVETEFETDRECLLARKRPRNEGEKSVWAFHTLSAGGQSLGTVEYETDRARFIGRGHTLTNPRGLDSRLGGTVGSVADPAFAMRRRLDIGPGERVCLIAITGAAESKEQALEIVRRLSHEQETERTFQLAWTRSQIELHHLHVTPSFAAVFQSLAGRALYAAPLGAERKQSIAANRKGQQGLWAHGVSGDLPIITVRIADTTNLSFVSKLLTGYEYMRHSGLFVDLVLLNESGGGYQQDLKDALQRTVEQIVGLSGAGQGGVHIVTEVELTEEDKCLLFAVSRIVLHAAGPSLRAQLRAADPIRSQEEHQPASTTPKHDTETAQAETVDYLFDNGWGGFSPDGREYQIALKHGNHLPAPWVNVMANPRFGCITSELYTGYTWWHNSRECKLTPWSNDPVLDRPGEVCYLRDEESGQYWTLPPARSHTDSPYRVTYGRGYTCYRHEGHGLRQEMTVFVPLDDPVKVIRLRLHNLTSDKRRLSVTYYAEWVLGVHRDDNASYIVTEWDERGGVLLARNTYQENFRDATAFLTVHPQVEQTWTGDRLEFIGRNGTFEEPAAMKRHHLSGDTGPSYDSCGAVQTKFEIEPESEQTVYILLGCEDSGESAAQLVEKYREADSCERAFADMQRFWDAVLGTITVSTPAPDMDVLLNNWLLYQTLSCRMWARSAFYQAGGAYGFRDQLQDSLALLHSRPDMTRAQILLHAAHQYEEGDVQHWWHEETHRGIRTRFSDDLLWLPYAVVRYLEHTEDESLLDETVPFLHSDPLGENEHERYEPTVLSEQYGTILDHCLRALERSLRFGEHGLPLIGIGDWNDGMSRVGAEGKGESVWLGWFLGDVLRGMSELCEHRGDHERAARYRHVQGELAVALNREGWDGQWYRRAFTDAGQWLGSIHNAECRIDAIAQSWSVISGMAPQDKSLQAMRSFDRELVDRSLGVAHILTPPFNRTNPSPGYIQGYPPGIRENGGQYTHGVIWSIIAWCGLGEGDKAFELFRMFNPITHTKTSADVRKYAGEPYAMAADIYTEEPHKGHAGWTWYTGASGWMYQAGVEWILGLRRRGERLFIRPCIPAEWPGYSVSYRFGSTEYRITVDNPSHKSSGQTMLSIDGQVMDLGDHSTEDGPFFRLRDDQQVHHVVLTL
jgi:cyclic beta-1,2-glucan synthetase